MKFRWRRVLIGFGIAGGAAYLYLLVFGAQFFLIKRDFKDPAMWKVPVELPNLAVLSAPGLKLSYFGWEFEVPWKDLDASKTKPIGKPPWQWQVISFHSGRRIIFYQTSRKSLVETSVPAQRFLYRKSIQPVVVWRGFFVGLFVHACNA